jgi:hypothetical protein
VCRRALLSHPAHKGDRIEVAYVQLMNTGTKVTGKSLFEAGEGKDGLDYTQKWRREKHDTTWSSASQEPPRGPVWILGGVLMR